MLAAAIAWLAISRLLVLCGRAPIAEEAIDGLGQIDSLDDLPDAPAGSWLALLLKARRSDDPFAFEDRLQALRTEATKHLAALSLLGRVASLLAVVGALWRLIWWGSGRHGLAGLVAGYAEREASEWLILHLGLGLSSWWLASAAARALRSEARARLAELDALARALGAGT